MNAGGSDGRIPPGQVDFLFLILSTQLLLWFEQSDNFAMLPFRTLTSIIIASRSLHPRHLMMVAQYRSCWTLRHVP